MKNTLLVFLTLISFVGAINLVNADVFIPKNEFLGYVDSNGIYTVVGAVKNTEKYLLIVFCNIIGLF